MALDKIAEKRNVDLAALAQSKNRLIYVTKTGPRKKGDTPKIKLFASPAKIAKMSPTYLEKFAGEVYPLETEMVLDVMKIRVSEEAQSAHRAFEFTTAVTPPNGDGASLLALGRDHPLVAGSIDGTKQRAFGEESRKNARVSGAGAHRGQVILKQFKSDVTKVLRFQMNHPLVFKAVARILERCAGGLLLPSFQTGDPLPAGFRQTFFSFVYDANPRADFPIDELDFRNGPWELLVRDPEKKALFATVIEAIRDRLITGSAAQFQVVIIGNKPIVFEEGESLAEIVETEINLSLSVGSQETRRAILAILQTLKSKTSLSMILEFAIEELHMIVAKNEGLDVDPDAMATLSRLVATAVTTGTAGLAKPVPRLGTKEQAEMKEQMGQQFDGMIKSLLAESDDAFNKASAGLSQKVRELVEAYRKDPEKKSRLARLVEALRGNTNPNLINAFSGALRILVQDVVFPGLNRSPALSEGDLRAIVQQEGVMSYLSALFLGDDNEATARGLAADHLLDMDAYVRTPAKTPEDLDKLIASILGDVVERVVITPRMEHCLTNELGVVRDALHYERPRTKGIGSFCLGVEPDRAALAAPTSGEVTPEHPSTIRALVHSEAKGQLNYMTRDPKATGDGAVSPPLETGIGAIVRPVLTGAMPQVKGKSVVLDDAGKTEIIVKAVDTVIQSRDSGVRIHDDLLGAEKGRGLTLLQYTRHFDKPEFRASVERAAVGTLMLQMGDELALGSKASNLYQFLLDLIGADPDHIDTFFQKYSILRYFDAANIDGRGLGALLQNLRRQGSLTRKNLVAAVSDLRGLQYLVEQIQQNSDAELIIVESGATEMLEWVERDNLDEGKGHLGLFRNGKLVVDEGSSQTVAPALLVLFSEASFTGTTKEAFLRRLAAMPFQRKGRSMMPFAVVLGTGLTGDDTDGFIEKGRALAVLADQAPVPVVIVGPALEIDSSGTFYLPASYVFAAQALRPDDEHPLVKPDTPDMDLGRFILTGTGGTSLYHVLNRGIFGKTDGSGYCFACDQYLMVVAMSLGALAKSGRREAIRGSEFFRHFVRNEEVANEADFQSTHWLDPAVLGGRAERFGFEQELKAAGDPLLSVRMGAEHDDRLSSSRSESFSVNNVHWFNRYRKAAGLD